MKWKWLMFYDFCTHFIVCVAILLLPYRPWQCDNVSRFMSHKIFKFSLRLFYKLKTFYTHSWWKSLVWILLSFKIIIIVVSNFFFARNKSRVIINICCRYIVTSKRVKKGLQRKFHRQISLLTSQQTQNILDDTKDLLAISIFRCRRCFCLLRLKVFFN